MLTVEEKKVLFEAAGRAFGAIARAAGLLREACFAVARSQSAGLTGGSGRRLEGEVVPGRGDP